MKTDNSYTYWSVRELKTLNTLRKQGYSWHEIAYHLGRSIGACKHRYSMIRMSEMMTNGSENDTLRTYKCTLLSQSHQMEATTSISIN